MVRKELTAPQPLVPTAAKPLTIGRAARLGIESALYAAAGMDAPADAIGGRAFFPFGTPHQPFLRWALRSGRAWSSPVHLLVHDTAGLMVSYRGAILVPQRLELPPLSQSPCDTCEAKPCIQACPASALTPAAYDLAACHAWLDSTEGQSCLEQGCAVRRSCPISATYGRMEAQSAFHMGYFHS